MGVHTKRVRVPPPKCRACLGKRVPPPAVTLERYVKNVKTRGPYGASRGEF